MTTEASKTDLPKNFIVRRVSGASEWTAVREICCDTGRLGEPIDPKRRPFFGEFWIGPYESLEPAWTFVALHENRVIGYLTGAPDTERFESRKRVHFTPKLFLKCATARFSWTSDLKRFLKTQTGLQSPPESSFSDEIRRSALKKYPAHLHVNVRAEFRGTSVGRELVETYGAELKKSGVGGIHLYCGKQPLKFYLKLGFREEAAIQYVATKGQEGAWVYLMTREI